MTPSPFLPQACTVLSAHTWCSPYFAELFAFFCHSKHSFGLLMFPLPLCALVLLFPLNPILLSRSSAVVSWQDSSRWNQSLSPLFPLHFVDSTTCIVTCNMVFTCLQRLRLACVCLAPWDPWGQKLSLFHQYVCSA